MDVLRADLMQPLQADLEALRQQRESLVQEIRQLERTRQQIDSLTQQKTTHSSKLFQSFPRS
jgi:prefoldin subunit 5